MNGWLNADLFVDGLKAAGPDFSRQKLIDAINKMTDYKANGLLQRRQLDGAAHRHRRHLLPVPVDDQGQQVRDRTSASRASRSSACVDSGGKLSAEYKG